MNDTTGTTQAPPPHPDRDDGPRVSRDEVRDLGRLRRTRHDRYVAGVAGGIARHLDIDPLIVRVAFVVLTFFGGAGLLAYAACWLLVPEVDTERATLDLDVRSRTVALFGVLVLAALFVVGDAVGGGPGWWFAWPLLIIGVIVWTVVAHRERRRAGAQAEAWARADTTVVGDPAAPPVRPDRPRDPRKRGPVLFWFVLPLVVLALGTLGIVEAAGVDVHDSAYGALALGIVTVGLLVGAFFGRAGGLILLGFVAALGLTAGTAIDRWDATAVRETPRSAAAVSADYDFGAGEVLLDLTAVRDLDQLDGRTVRIDGGAGRIEVRVPREALDVTVDAQIHAGGEIRLFDRTRNGWDPKLSEEHDGGDDVPTLHLEADLGVGEIKVVTR